MSKVFQWSTFGALALLGLLVFGSAAHAESESASSVEPQPGTLDPSYADNGVFSYQPDLTTDPDSDFEAVAIQDDGKAVAAGDSGEPGSGRQTLVTRLTEDGDLDPSFSGDGVFEYQAGQSDSNLNDVVVQDGNVVVAGSSEDSNLNSQTLVMRLSESGELDPSFSGDGVFEYQASSTGFSELDAIAIQSDGKIVGGGESEDSNSNSQTLVMRLSESGELDPSFSGDGVFEYQAGQSESNLNDVVVQDGNVVAAGSSEDSNSNSQTLVMRLSESGELDPSFGVDGVFEYQASSTGFSELDAIAIQSDGKIVGGGEFDDPSSEMAVLIIRLTEDGTLDPSFADGGVFRYQVGEIRSDVESLVIQADNKIVAVGDADNQSGEVAFVLRLTASGVLDAGFGTGGVFTYGESQAIGVDLQQNGKIIVVGQTNDPDPGASNQTLAMRLFGFGDADVAITKTASPNPVVTGNTVTFTVTVTNLGAETAINLRLTDSVPSVFADVKTLSIPGGWVDKSSGNNVVYEGAYLAAGASVTFVYSAVATKTTTVTNNATITWANNDGGTASTSVQVTIDPEPDQSATLPFTGTPRAAIIAFLGALIASIGVLCVLISRHAGVARAI